MTAPVGDDVSGEDRATARELAMLCRSGVGGTELREQAIVEALAAVRAEELAGAIAEISRDRDNCPNKVRRQGYGGALYVLKSRAAALAKAVSR